MRFQTIILTFILFTLAACTTTATSPPSPTANTLFADGFSALRAEEWQQAKTAFTAGLLLEPNARAAFTGRGQASLKLKQYQDATADFTSALLLDDQDAAAWAGRGRANLEMEQYTTAVFDLNHAIALSPFLASNYTNRGLAHYHQANYDAAIADFTRAIRADSSLLRPYFWRGLAYKHTGDEALAAADFTHVIENESSLAESAQRHLSRLDVDPITAEIEPTSEISFTFADVGKRSFTVDTIFDQVQVHFPLAENQQVEQATLQLSMAHSARLLPDLSEMTIVLNDEPIANFALTADNVGPTIIPIDLPAAALHTGDNVLTFRFRQRLEEDGCGDANSSDLWVKVLNDTAVFLNTTESASSFDLSQFPAPFNTLSTIGGSPQATIVLPAQPTPTELTIAAQIAAVLGQASQWETPPLQAVTADKLDDSHYGNHLIVIDTGGRNSLPETAVSGISSHQSPFHDNRLLLVVSGDDADDLQQAADMLTTRSAWGILHDTHTESIPVAAQAAPQQQTQATFSQLGYTDKHLRGIGPHDLYYQLDIPYDWKITSEASLELYFSHAPNLGRDSVLNAYINGDPVAEVPLTNRNDENGRLSIQLSPRQLHPGRNWLHLNIDLHMKQEECRYRYLEKAWADISAATSTLDLVHVNSSPPLELRYLPSPLITPADLSQNLMVLSDQPTTTELTTMVQLAAKLGTYTDADGLRLRATTAALFNANTAQSTRIIAIGVPDTHTLLASINDDLPFPMEGADEEDEDELLEPLSEELEREGGYVQLLPAPWSNAGALVVVTGMDDAALARAITAFPARGERRSVQGNVAVVSDENEVIGLSLGTLAGLSLPESSRRVLAVVLMFVFLLIGGIGLLINRRQKRAGR